MACYVADPKLQEKEADEETKPREKEAEEDEMTSSDSDSDSEELIAFRNMLRSQGNPDGNVISCCCVSRRKEPIRIQLGQSKRKHEFEQPVKKKMKEGGKFGVEDYYSEEKMEGEMFTAEDCCSEKKMEEGDMFTVEDCCSDDDIEQGIWYKYDRVSCNYEPPRDTLISYANLAIDSYNKDNSKDYRLVEVVRAIAHLVEEVRETEHVVNGAYYRMILEVRLPNQDDFDAITLYAEYNTGVFGNGKVELVCKARNIR